MNPSLPETLMRTIDLSYPSNRYAVGGAAGTVLLSRLSGRSWSAAGRAGALAFLAWAVARELDPDHSESASVALPLAAVLAWMEGERRASEAAVDLAGAGATLAGLRFVTGSVGAVPAQIDFLSLLGAASLSALTGQRSPALLAALAPAATRLSSGEEMSDDLPRGVAALLPTLFAAQGSGSLSRLAALISLVTAPQLTAPEGVEAQTDQGTGRVSAQRVRVARLMSSGAAALGALEGRGSTAGLLAAVHLAVVLRRTLNGSSTG